jgi:superfamily II DNA/RNA helicase
LYTLRVSIHMFRQNYARNNTHRPFRAMGRRNSTHFAPRQRDARVNPDRYINKATDAEEQIQYTSTNQFADFDISPELKANIVARGYTTPTPIQDQIIPYVLEGRDVVGVANTGTGKTAAFLIPLINKIMKDRMQKVLIIAPTRELATQIEDELRLFAKGTGITSALVIGGASMGTQIQKLRQRPNFVISTAGRLMDFVDRRMVTLADFNTIVLDEVDRMVDIGFIRDIRTIVSALPRIRQSLFFSATVSGQVSGILATFTSDPVTISVKVKDTVESVDQNIIRVKSKEEKLSTLHTLLHKEEFSKVLIFGRTKWNVEKLARTLSDSGFSVGSIHGNKSQNQRIRVLNEFKENRLQILVATDVASRGLDISDVSHVINFDEPESYDDYVHRIGRTGRANKAGVALTFVG